MRHEHWRRRHHVSGRGHHVSEVLPRSAVRGVHVRRRWHVVDWWRHLLAVSHCLVAEVHRGGRHRTAHVRRVVRHVVRQRRAPGAGVLSDESFVGRRHARHHRARAVEHSVVDHRRQRLAVLLAVVVHGNVLHRACMSGKVVVVESGIWKRRRQHG